MNIKRKRLSQVWVPYKCSEFKNSKSELSRHFLIKKIRLTDPWFRRYIGPFSSQGQGEQNNPHKAPKDEEWGDRSINALTSWYALAFSIHKRRPQFFSNFAKMTIDNSAENTGFLARSNFNSSANVGPSMTNDGALESWQQGVFILGILGCLRGTQKNKLLVQSKQTVQ